MCHLRAWNVPVVCTYFMVRKTGKYELWRFQRRVARVSTTKTRFCGSIRDLVIFIEFLSFVPTAKHLNPSGRNIKSDYGFFGDAIILHVRNHASLFNSGRLAI